MSSTPFHSNKETGEIVWGIRVPTMLKRNWMSLAGIIRVPVSWPVLFVLDDWLKTNAAVFKSEKGRQALSQLILQQNQSDGIEVLPKTTDESLGEMEEADNLRTDMSIKGVTIEARLKLKVMAIDKGLSIGRLLGEMVNKVWQEEGDRIQQRHISSRRLGKEFSKMLRTLLNS